jgi:hypothetical protein
VGQAENVYSQPQDPQMQIQPMFIGVAGFLGLLLFVRQRFSHKRFLAFTLAVAVPLVAANYAYTLSLMAGTATSDSESIRLHEGVRRQFPPSSTFLVLVGFEALLTWETVLYYEGDITPVMARSVLTATPFTWVPRADGPKVSQYMRERMEPAYKKGMRLYSNILWNESKQSFQGRFITVAPPEESGRLYDDMLPRYRVKPGSETSTYYGNFVEIVPVNP